MFNIVIIVTTTFSPNIPALDSLKLRRVVSNLNASFTYTSILVALYKLSISREDRKLYIFTNTQLPKD